MEIKSYTCASEMRDTAAKKIKEFIAIKIERCLETEKRVERLLSFSVNEIKKCAENGSMYTTLTLYQAPDALPNELPYFGYREREICSLCMILSYLGFIAELSNFSYENEPEKYTVTVRWDEFSSEGAAMSWELRKHMLDSQNYMNDDVAKNDDELT